MPVRSAIISFPFPDSHKSRSRCSCVLKCSIFPSIWPSIPPVQSALMRFPFAALSHFPNRFSVLSPPLLRVKLALWITPASSCDMCAKAEEVRQWGSRRSGWMGGSVPNLCAWLDMRMSDCPVGRTLAACGWLMFQSTHPSLPSPPIQHPRSLWSQPDQRFRAHNSTQSGAKGWPARLEYEHACSVR